MPEDSDTSVYEGMDFVVCDVLDSDTSVYQVHDGTLFYRNDDRLYVKWEGTEIDVQLPQGHFYYIGLPITIPQIDVDNALFNKQKAISKRETDVKEALNEVYALDAFDHPGIVKYNHSWIEEPPDEWQMEWDSELLDRLGPQENLLSRGFRFANGSRFLYIQMELCKCSLANWLSDANNGQRNENRMKTWFKQIVSAVAYIHEHGKIHRDLKPSNILLTAYDRLKICDLGIIADLALAEDQEEVPLSRTFDRGTIMYRAPEQIGWVGYTSRVDIFPLGLILTELLVDMTVQKTAEIFKNYREKVPETILNHVPQAKALVSWMIKEDATKRPSCEEILKSEFFLS